MNVLSSQKQSLLTRQVKDTNLQKYKPRKYEKKLDTTREHSCQKNARRQQAAEVKMADKRTRNLNSDTKIKLKRTVDIHNQREINIE